MQFGLQVLAWKEPSRQTWACRMAPGWMKGARRGSVALLPWMGRDEAGVEDLQLCSRGSLEGPLTRRSGKVTDTIAEAVG